MDAVKRFFSSPHFAVAGASNDPKKFGYKSKLPGDEHDDHTISVVICFSNMPTVLAWYHQHSLPVTPINPRGAQIIFSSKTYDSVTSPKSLPSPTQTSLSLVTALPVSLQVLQEAHALGIPAVWLQPGTYDTGVLDYAHKNFESVIAGDGGRGSDGWCVLVDGEEGLQAAGVDWTSQRL